MNESSLLTAENVSKEYPAPLDGVPVKVLTRVTLTVEAKETIAVVGPSGSGKSTLLNIMSGMDEPTSGSVAFEKRNMAEMSSIERAILRNRDIGFVFQLHHLLPQCTALENVLIPTLAFRTKPKRASEGGLRNNSQTRAREILSRVGLDDRVNHLPSELSVGERQRVAVARAFINKPKIVLADEPTGSLDSESSMRLSELLFELSRLENTALVVVTHATDLAEMLGKQYRLMNGKLFS